MYLGAMYQIHLCYCRIITVPCVAADVLFSHACCSSLGKRLYSCLNMRQTSLGSSTDKCLLDTLKEVKSCVKDTPLWWYIDWTSNRVTLILHETWLKYAYNYHCHSLLEKSTYNTSASELLLSGADTKSSNLFTPLPPPSLDQVRTGSTLNLFLL